jgi:hypothetical protein
MPSPLVSVIGVHSPTLDRGRYDAFVAEQVNRQNPINFPEELKSFLRRVGRESEIVALSPEELSERREYFEQEFAGVAQVEVLVENPDECFKIGGFQQVDPSVPSSRWQVAWNERFLTFDGMRVLGEYSFNELPTQSRYRVAFFVHAWRHELGLNSTYGPLSLPPLSPIPERLWQLAPFELVD